MQDSHASQHERYQSSKTLLQTALWLGWLLIGLNAWMIVQQ